MLELIGKTHIDFLGRRKIAFTISGLLVLLGLATLVQIGLGKANLGIDFEGGTSVQLDFEHPVLMEEARRIMVSGGFPDADIQEFTGTNKLLIRVKRAGSIEEKASAKLRAIFRDALPDNPFVVDSVTEVGPSIGDRLQKDAILAVFLSMLGIMAYIAMRFEFRFGVAAAIATFHDVLAVLGLFVLVGKEVNLLLITSLLTVAGYSLNDTVVVYDRIRENLRRRHKESLEQVINNAVNQVLSRTLITSGTTLLVVVALTFWGGEVLHDFALALLIGIVIGTYSSIYVASAIVLVWRGKAGKIVNPEPDAEEATP
ncbi:MAG: protein translocase subunit SecF [Nitrospirae bacterium]|nr:protein translocase subunit SecF [Nitrospirota bacterium]